MGICNVTLFAILYMILGCRSTCEPAYYAKRLPARRSYKDLKLKKSSLAQIARFVSACCVIMVMKRSLAGHQSGDLRHGGLQSDVVLVLLVLALRVARKSTPGMRSR